MAFLCHLEERTFNNRVKTRVIRAVALVAPASCCISWGRSLTAHFQCYRPCVSQLPPRRGLAVPMHVACKLLQESCEGH